MYLAKGNERNPFPVIKLKRHIILSLVLHKKDDNVVMHLVMLLKVCYENVFLYVTSFLLYSFCVLVIHICLSYVQCVIHLGTA